MANIAQLLDAGCEKQTVLDFGGCVRSHRALGERCAATGFHLVNLFREQVKGKMMSRATGDVLEAATVVDFLIDEVMAKLALIAPEDVLVHSASITYTQEQVPGFLEALERARKMAPAVLAHSTESADIEGTVGIWVNEEEGLLLGDLEGQQAWNPDGDVAQDWYVEVGELTAYQLPTSAKAAAAELAAEEADLIEGNGSGGTSLWETQVAAAVKERL